MEKQQNTLNNSADLLTNINRMVMVNQGQNLKTFSPSDIIRLCKICPSMLLFLRRESKAVQEKGQLEGGKTSMVYKKSL